MKSLVIVLILTITVYYGNCAKILGILPMPGRSHYILGSSLMRGLAERGHDVTVISTFGEKDPPKNGTYRDIIVTGLKDTMEEMRKQQNFSMFDRHGTNPIMMSIFMGAMFPGIINKVWEHENVQKLIHSDEKFDVVIVEQFMNDAQKAFATHFGAALVVLSSIGPNHWVNPLVGNPAPPSYVPEVMLGSSVPVSFYERLTNTLVYVFNELLYHLYIYYQQNAVIKKHIPNGPELSDVLYNASLILLNSHTSINQPVPLVPNMVEIGGFHIKPPKKLPQDLQDFLDNAKDGVIYFSMGSNLKSAQLPPKTRDAFLKTFSKLKPQILWKWEDDVLPGQPPNVKLSKWLPQQDVLAHPNIKLFITHGGYLSTTETVYHGVPVLAIPIFGDQELNAQNAVNGGYGLMVPYSEISEEKLTQSIKELLDNPKYRNNAKKRSELFHDRIASPMDTAAYWIDYVARHKGTPHLRVAGVDLPWYKYHLLDVIGFVAIVVLVSAFIFYRLVKFVCRKYCSKNKQKSKKVKFS